MLQLLYAVSCFLAPVVNTICSVRSHVIASKMFALQFLAQVCEMWARPVSCLDIFLAWVRFRQRWCH